MPLRRREWEALVRQMNCAAIEASLDRISEVLEAGRIVMHWSPSDQAYFKENCETIVSGMSDIVSEIKEALDRSYRRRLTSAVVRGVHALETARRKLEIQIKRVIYLFDDYEENWSQFEDMYSDPWWYGTDTAVRERENLYYLVEQAGLIRELIERAVCGTPIKLASRNGGETGSAQPQEDAGTSSSSSQDSAEDDAASSARGYWGDAQGRPSRHHEPFTRASG